MSTFSLVDSHLLCNIELWGGLPKSILKPLKVLQKRALCTVINAPRNSPSDQIFRWLKVLPLVKVYQWQMGCMMLRAFHGCLLPNIQQYFSRQENRNRTTRQTSTNLIVRRRGTKKQNLRMSVVGPYIWNSLPADNKSTADHKIAQNKIKNVLNDSYNLSEHKPIGPIGTFNGFDHNMVPQNRIDYIFTQNLKVLTYQVINDKRENQRCISDHLPVLIEVSKK